MRSCLPYKSINQARSVASAEDAKNCEESDMAIPAGLNEALREHRAARTWRLTTGTHAVNLVLQILETR
jgi:hypothetical protein